MSAPTCLPISLLGWGLSDLRLMPYEVVRKRVYAYMPDHFLSRYRPRNANSPRLICAPRDAPPELGTGSIWCAAPLIVCSLYRQSFTFPNKMAALKVSTGFNINSSSSSDDGDAPLPFPSALPRSDFLSADFQPAEYLSSLPQRHQTLEDLRSELRERSSAISAELLELVNNNYTAFLSLGVNLRGGDERIEDVKVALLGFRRAVEEVRSRVSARGEGVDTLNKELGEVRTDIEIGRKMLELDERLSDLEHRLAIGDAKKAEDDTPFGGSSDDEGDDESDSDSGDSLIGSSPSKLAGFVRDLTMIDQLSQNIGRELPFVVQAEERSLKCRDTILIDLGNALREARGAGPRGQARLLKYLNLYRSLEAAEDAVMALKGSK